MANWRCPDCGVVLDATEEGKTETCPFCGLDMDPIEPVKRPEGPLNIDVPLDQSFSYRLRAVPRKRPKPDDDIPND